MENMYYYSFNEYLKKKFGCKVRRVSLNAGFSCPHKGAGKGEGCIFCNEYGFSPNASGAGSIERQLKEGISKLSAKYGPCGYIAYFQNATGTNASLAELRENYDAVKKFKEVNSIYISTRPDCVSEEKLELIAGYAEKYDVWLEYGVQTSHDRTLQALNRRHTWLDSVNAINAAAKKGIKVGAHIILGLPGESQEDMAATAKAIGALPVSGVKLHVLHVLKNTELERLYAEGKIKLMSRDEYITAACSFMEYLDPGCVMLRVVSDAYKDFLVAPLWINDKSDVIDGINMEFGRRGTRQGSCFRHI
jgi:hypothetical protein